MDQGPNGSASGKPPPIALSKLMAKAPVRSGRVFAWDRPAHTRSDLEYQTKMIRYMCLVPMMGIDACLEGAVHHRAWIFSERGPYRRGLRHRFCNECGRTVYLASVDRCHCQWK